MDNRKTVMDIGSAMASLAPTSAWVVRDGVLEWNDTEETRPTDAEIDTEVIRLQAEYDTQEYARNRQAEYPDWGTQLEKIDDDGLTRWREEMIDPIKSKWPKDNSGPK